MKDKAKYRFTIKQKITIFILISSFFVGFVGLALIYWSEYKLLRQTISRDYLAMTRLLGDSMNRIISREITNTEVFMSSSECLQNVQEYNLRYAGMSSEIKKAYFKDMDERWAKASNNDPLISEYTKSPLGNRLREIARDDPSIAEIFMTDKYGGLVAASNRTTDFYQADEEWWQKSFNYGKGSVFLEKIGFDPSSKTVGIAIAIPIKNKLKEIIGVCKNYLEVKRLFSPLENFSIGKSGYVALVDKQGYLIFHPGTQAMKEKFPDKVYKKIISRNSGYLLINEIDQLHKKKMFLSYFKVTHPELLKSGIEWWICIAQDDDEVFAPLLGLIFSFIPVALIMVVIVITTGFYFGAILVKPIIKLRDATQKVAKGSLDYKVEIKTNDEIEDLADSFNSMLDGLKNTFTTIDKLNNEIILRKEISDELQYASAEWQRTFDSISDLVFILDKDSAILKANKSCFEALKLKPEEVIGRKCYEVVHRLGSPWPNCPFKKTCIDQKIHIEEVDDPRLGVMFLVTTSPIFKDNGEFVGAIHIAKDITQIKKYQHDLESKNKELEKLDQLKSDFVSIVSHELRTPLSITKEGISLVLDGVTGEINPKQSKILTTSKNNIDRLARIINSLLDISKIESGRVELKKTSVDVVSLIKNVASSFQIKAKEKGIELRVELPEAKEINLYVDEDRIIQVFTNLIGNALKFTEKGSVTVSLTQEQDQVEFMVSDTGMGIVSKDLPNIFNKFMQFGRVAGGGEKGTGLGLSIAKGLIELHRGQIWVESEAQRGSKFIFTLPRYSVDQRARDQIEDAINNALRASAHFSLMVVTLRYSGKLNKEIPAAVLIDIEKIIMNELHKSKDLFLRFANEFFIILQDCNKNSALIVQGRIQQALRSYFNSINLGEDLRIDFGLAIYPDEANSYQELMNKAKQV